jgi:uncharacterized integral membrane protein
MPWKLLALILLMAFVLVFVGFNLDNRSDLSLVFYTFNNVPVVITLLVSFLMGLVVAFIFTVSKALKPGSSKSAERHTRKSARSNSAGMLDRSPDHYQEAPPHGAGTGHEAASGVTAPARKRTRSKNGKSDATKTAE